MQEAAGGIGRRARAVVEILVVTLVAVTLVEAAVLPAQIWRAGPSTAAAVVAWSGALLGGTFLPVWISLAIFVAGVFDDGSLRRRAILAGVGAFAIGNLAYLTFGIYGPLVEGWRAFAGVTVGALVLASLGVLVPRAERRWLRVAVGAALVAGWLGLSFVNATTLRNQYPALHGGLLVAAVASAGAGLAVLSRERPGARFGSFLVASALALAGALCVLVVDDRAAGAARAYSHVGRWEGAAHDLEERAGAAPAQVEDAEALFLRHARLPALSSGFSVDDYNVLLVTVEALRQDETSLASPDRGKKRAASRDNTPRLAARARDGGVVFDRAYAPSSGTLHSMSSVLAMGWPSALRLDTWRRPWLGELSLEETTVAEVFARAGRHTFWIGHNFRSIFDRAVIGFDQGFAHTDLVHSGRNTADSDEEIVDRAIAHLERRPAGGAPWFGWVFLVSPHGNYVKHYEDQPGRGRRARYRQEVRYVDEQLGRLFDALSARDRWRDTIVIVTSDHGEELGDHGGWRHKSTVYEEVARVPLVVWLPAGASARAPEPTSNGYVLPWLLLSSRGAPRETALRRVEEVYAPMLAAVQGDVVVELIGHDRMLTALIRGNRKLNLDLLADHIELYDLRVDRTEQRDRYLVDDEAASAARQRADAYLDARGALARYSIDREREPAPKKPKEKP
jgi:hypothetical protein